ncbi:MAG: efflux RND transporter permease subunit [Elusimicrobiaceae bacterium]|nr:efflux RND transporter permease subunit [Elusimicrobiaceae bacterium]
MEKLRRSFIEVALKHQTVVVTVCAILCVLGIYSLMTMPRQEFPEFKVRQGLVIAAFPGASSNQVDEQLAKPLQNYLFRYKEIDREKTYSVSKENQTIVFVEVKENVKEPEIFWAKLRLGLQEFKSELPSQVVMLVGNNEFGDASAILLTVTSKQRTYRELEDYLAKLEDKIRQHPAVSNVKKFGLQKEKIIVYADPNRLAHYGVKPALLMGALQMEGMLGYGGYIKDSDLELPIHLPPRYNSEADVAEQIVFSSPDGAIVRVRDVARVVREYDVEDSYVECEGRRALVLSMEMRFGNNIVSFGKDIDRIIADFKADSPADLEIAKVADMPKVVSASLHHFFRDFGMAILAVILVVILLLPRRIAMVAAVTIPICILQSLGIMQGLGVELNTISLAALVVVLGMVVDNAIVVIDNHVEKLDHGIDVRTAAWSSARELLIPVFTATLAIVAVFAMQPIFMTGMARDFIGPMPVTIAVTLFVSMFIAMLLVPALSCNFIKTGLHEHGKGPEKKGKPSLLDRLQEFYNRHLEISMAHPVRTVWIGIAAIVLGILMFTLLPQQLMPALERDQFAVEMYFPEGTSLARNAQITGQMVKILKADKRIKTVVSFIGTSSPRFHTLYAPQMPAKNYSQLIVMTESVKATEDVVREYDRKYRDAFPGAHARFKQISFLSAEAPVEVRISGDSIPEIRAFADKVRAVMAQDGDITWLRDDYRNPRIAVDLDVNRELANRLGVNRAILGLSCALNRNGIPITKVWEGDYAKDVVLKYDESKTSSPEELENQYVTVPLSPKALPLRQLAGLKPSFSEGQIVRRNGRLTMTLRADVAAGKLFTPVQNRISEKLAALDKPESIAVSYGGEHQLSGETYVPMVESLIVSIIVIFVVLLFQFQSIRLALLVMITMPLSIIGGMAGLSLVGMPFSMTALLGLTALFGTVVRNGVILISYARELEHGGMPLKEAAFAAGKRRMRPIFLTAAAAAVGVIPLMTSGSSLWGPMGAVICFGLIGSTILTLYVLPVAYWKYSGDEEETARGGAVMRTNKSLFMLALLACPVFCAQASAGMTLADYKKQALAHNNELKQSALEDEAAQQAVRSAFTSYFPKVSAVGAMGTANIIPGLAVMSGMPSVLSPLSRADGYALSMLVAQQPVFVGGRIVNGNRLARVGAAAAHEQFQLKRDEVLLESEKKYRRLLVLEEKRKTLLAYAEMLESLYKQVNQAAGLGLVTRTDVLRVGLKRAELGASRTELEKGIALAQRDLRLYAGLPEGDPIIPSAGPDVITEPVYNRQYLASRLSLRPEYRLLQANADAAKLQRKMKTGANLPLVSVGAAINRLDALSSGGTFQNSLGFAVVSVPLSDWWGGSHDVKEKRLKENAAQVRLESVADYLVLDMESRLKDYEQAYQRVAVARLGVEEADANKSEIEDGYKNGTEKLSDLLEAMALQQQSRDRLSEETAGYFAARTAFEIAISAVSADN